jgi:hypothetical protein
MSALLFVIVNTVVIRITLILFATEARLSGFYPLWQKFGLYDGILIILVFEMLVILHETVLPMQIGVEVNNAGEFREGDDVRSDVCVLSCHN